MDDKLATNKVIPTSISAGNILARIFLPKTIWRLINPIDPDSD